MNSEEIILYVLWIAGGVTFIIYPGILLAGIMSLAAHREKGKNRNLFFTLFLLITLAYPLIYFISYKCSSYFWEIGKFNFAVIATLPPIAIGLLIYWQLKKK